MNEVFGQRSEMVVRPKNSKPSIPSKKTFKPIHTGVGADNPGPAGYNPEKKVVLSSARKTDFMKDRQQRRLWENTNSPHNVYPDPHNPGPGLYDGMKMKHQFDYNYAGNTSSFASKVPVCKELALLYKNTNPGPGQYLGSEEEQLQSQKAQHNDLLQHVEQANPGAVNIGGDKSRMATFNGMNNMQAKDLHKKMVRTYNTSSLSALEKPSRQFDSDIERQGQWKYTMNSPFKP